MNTNSPPKKFIDFKKEFQTFLPETPKNTFIQKQSKNTPHTKSSNHLNLKVQLIETALKRASHYFDKIVFSSSLGMEDQVLTDIIFRNDLPIKIFTLDTGRLFNETYTVLAQTTEKYGQPIQLYYPETQKVETYVRTHGINAFKNSIALRKECCAIRKLEPLRRALLRADLWITGIRSRHSTQRQEEKAITWDENHQIGKFNPLLNWSDDEILSYIRQERIPYNPLHDNGFVSIGCAPCTRAIGADEDFRAGRWWWEQEGPRECGIHLNPTSPSHQ